MRYLLPLLLLLGGCAGCTSVPTHDQLRATALRLEFERGVCSGTAVAADQILTAAHCLQGGELRIAGGQNVRVVKVVKEGRDTALLTVSGPMFKRWATRGPRPTQGQRIRFWGQPGGNPDVYREGYVARAWSDGIVIVAPVCFGDSGSGAFSDDGKLVAVISAMTAKSGCAFGIAVE